MQKFGRERAITHYWDDDELGIWKGSVRKRLKTGRFRTGFKRFYILPDFSRFYKLLHV